MNSYLIFRDEEITDKIRVRNPIKKKVGTSKTQRIPVQVKYEAHFGYRAIQGSYPNKEYDLIGLVFHPIRNPEKKEMFLVELQYVDMSYEIPLGKIKEGEFSYIDQEVLARYEREPEGRGMLLVPVAHFVEATSLDGFLSTNGLKPLQPQLPKMINGFPTDWAREIK